MEMKEVTYQDDRDARRAGNRNGGGACVYFLKKKGLYTGYFPGCHAAGTAETYGTALYTLWEWYGIYRLTCRDDIISLASRAGLDPSSDQVCENCFIGLRNLSGLGVPDVSAGTESCSDGGYGCDDEDDDDDYDDYDEDEDDEDEDEDEDDEDEDEDGGNGGYGGGCDGGGDDEGPYTRWFPGADEPDDPPPHYGSPDWEYADEDSMPDDMFEAYDESLDLSDDEYDYE